MANNMDLGQRTYGDGTNSSIGTQLNTFFYQKKALIEAAKEQYFGQMADSTAMPKHFGKKIKLQHYVPILDDANVNDQGIDAAGVSTAIEVTVEIKNVDGTLVNTPYVDRATGNFRYFVGKGATEALALDDLGNKMANYASAPVAAGGLGVVITATAAAAIAEVVTDTAASVTWTANEGATAVTASTDLTGLGVSQHGNLYGSAKDIGTISGKIPALSEFGGRVNRVGMTRLNLEGSFEKFGFFQEYTQESLDFDSDAELETHINREMIMAANEITEDALQIDLINGAGVVRYPGAAVSKGTISGDNGGVTALSYEELLKLSVDLDNNRCPKNTKLISGSRMIDTRVISGARYMFIGSELVPQLMALKDADSNRVFVPIEQYANAGNVARGEIGSIGHFRLVVVPEMMHEVGEGATVGTNDGFRETGGKYDLFPMLVVGSGSFTTIGFQTDGKTTKFKVYNKKPGEGMATIDDPYGESGFSSIKWYYGSMILRPERLALVWSLAEW